MNTDLKQAVAQDFIALPSGLVLNLPQIMSIQAGTHGFPRSAEDKLPAVVVTYPVASGNGFLVTYYLRREDANAFLESLDDRGLPTQAIRLAYEKLLSVTTHS